jgi:hypothetical protein
LQKMHSETATVASQRRSSIDSLLRFFDAWARRYAPLPTLRLLSNRESQLELERRS